MGRKGFSVGFVELPPPQKEEPHASPPTFSGTNARKRKDGSRQKPAAFVSQRRVDGKKTRLQGMTENFFVCIIAISNGRSFVERESVLGGRPPLEKKNRSHVGRWHLIFSAKQMIGSLSAHGETAPTAPSVSADSGSGGHPLARSVIVSVARITKIGLPFGRPTNRRRARVAAVAIATATDPSSCVCFLFHPTP